MGNQESLLGSDYPISQSNCRIVVVGAKSGDKALLALSHLPQEARIIATGNNLEEIQKDGDLYGEVSLQSFLNDFIILPLRYCACCNLRTRLIFTHKHRETLY